MKVECSVFLYVVVIHTIRTSTLLQGHDGADWNSIDVADPSNVYGEREKKQRNVYINAWILLHCLISKL
jgi:hypothetical protein